jgi:hypothetical protein
MALGLGEQSVKRREFITGLASTATLVWPLAAHAQQPERVRRIGVLMGYGESDPEGKALTWAAREARILLTFDKDFGELARAAALPATCGVVLFRIPVPKPGDVGQHLADLIAARDDWAGHFSVVEPGRVRMRVLA